MDETRRLPRVRSRRRKRVPLFTSPPQKFIRNQFESEPYPLRKSRSSAFLGLTGEFGEVLHNRRKGRPGTQARKLKPAGLNRRVFLIPPKNLRPRSLKAPLGDVCNQSLFVVEIIPSAISDTGSVQCIGAICRRDTELAIRPRTTKRPPTKDGGPASAATIRVTYPFADIGCGL